jgi:hypothetical protein
MPLYSVLCRNGHSDQIWSRIADRDRPRQCVCGAEFQRVLEAPFVRPEIAPYASPVTGKPITSRQERREELRREGCLEWEPGMREQAEANRQAALDRDFRSIEATIDSQVTALHSQNLI